MWFLLDGTNYCCRAGRGAGEPNWSGCAISDPRVNVKPVRTLKTNSALAIAETQVLFIWVAKKDDVKRFLTGAPQLKWIHSGRGARFDSVPELIASPIPLTNGRRRLSASRWASS